MSNVLLRTALASLALAPIAGASSPHSAWPAPISASVTIRADRPGPIIHRNVYGHFAEHLGRGVYEGIWVGEDSPIPNTRDARDDVVAALRRLRVPVVRWPGGCFAEEYHWRDGIGPREKRPVRINTTWGGVEEPNAFGTHEFLDFVEQIGAAAYLAGNVGSGSPGELAGWVERRYAHIAGVTFDSTDLAFFAGAISPAARALRASTCLRRDSPVGDPRARVEGTQRAAR